jgi:hypothetical protein
MITLARQRRFAQSSNLKHIEAKVSRKEAKARRKGARFS